MIYKTSFGEFKSVKEMRSKLADLVIDQFISTGLRFTCIASLTSNEECRRLANDLAKELLASGITFSKSSYVFTHQAAMRDMILMDAAKQLFL